MASYPQQLVSLNQSRPSISKYGYVVEEAIDALGDAMPVCGWKLGERSMRLSTVLSAYHGVSLSLGGATHSQSRDCANTFGA